MACHFWPAPGPEDSLLVPNQPPDDYLEYLGGLGFKLPEFRTEPDGDRLFTPFGWSREAADLNRGYRRPAAHPDRKIVARVNSREFGAQLEAEVIPEFGNGFKSLFFKDVDSLRHWLEKAPPGPYVGKGNHGFGGLAQIRFNPAGLDAESRENLERLLIRHGGMAVETEDVIATEFGILFRLGRDGRPSPPRMHRLLTNESGGFYGSMVLEKDSDLDPWRVDLKAAMDKISRRLFQEGYFGPVGFDAYVRKGPEGLRLRPFSDLNARCTMAFGVHGLAGRLPGRAVAVLQFSTKSMRIPESYPEWQSCLGADHFETESQRGIFILTPLGVGMQRHSLALVGYDDLDLQGLKSILRGFSSHG